MLSGGQTLRLPLSTTSLQLKIMRRASIIAAASAIACLCSSQVEAPQQQLDRLLGDSPVVLGANGAWMIQEARVIHTGQVKGMLFGPGKDEVVIAARDRVSITADMFTNPQKAAGLATVGDKITVVNVVTGSRRQIALPRTDLQLRELFWRSSRIVQVSANSQDWQGTILVDAATGTFAALPNSESTSTVASDIGHLAAAIKRQSGANSEKIFLELIDFSVSPPSIERSEAPAVAGGAMQLTKDRTLICRDSSGGLVELDLGTLKIRPWHGDPETINRSTWDSSWREGLLPPQKLEANIRKGKEGGLWVGEVQPFTPHAPGSRPPASPAGLRPVTRISKDADLAMINPDGTRVLFRSLGVAFSADVTEVDKDAVTQAMLAAARTQALSWARQAVLANIIYSADYGPSSDLWCPDSRFCQPLHF